MDVVGRDDRCVSSRKSGHVSRVEDEEVGQRFLSVEHSPEIGVGGCVRVSRAEGEQVGQRLLAVEQRSEGT